jgi:DNA integrity scanning protein DisA with diadenylate cyclase activity
LVTITKKTDAKNNLKTSKMSPLIHPAAQTYQCINPYQINTERDSSNLTSSELNDFLTDSSPNSIPTKLYYFMITRILREDIQNFKDKLL